MTRARWKRRFILLAGLVIILAGSLLALFLSLQHVPEFYQDALKDPQITPKVAEKVTQRTDQFIQELERTDSDVNQWKETISEQECNAWLAYELPRQFPELNTQGISNPRVCFEHNLILLGCEYEGARFSGVVSVALRPRLSQFNKLTLEIESANIGQVPLPLDSLVEMAQGFARSQESPAHGVVIEWDPASSNSHRGRLTLKPSNTSQMELLATSIQVEDDFIQISGERVTAETANTARHQAEGEAVSAN